MNHILERFDGEMKKGMNHDREGVDWKNWSPEELRDYIRAIRKHHAPDAYGRYCQWLKCEADHLPDGQFCAAHELVARTNE